MARTSTAATMLSFTESEKTNTLHMGLKFGTYTQLNYSRIKAG